MDISRNLLRAGVFATAVAAIFGQSSQAPLSLTISATEGTVQSGSDLRVEITATNISDHDIDFATMGGKGQAEKNFNIEVRNSEGKEPVETEYGLMIHGKGPVGRSGSVRTMRLKPGQKYQDYSILNRVYDLSEPGTYTIQASRRDSENKAGVKSNTITITVNK